MYAGNSPDDVDAYPSGAFGVTPKISEFPKVSLFANPIMSMLALPDDSKLVILYVLSELNAD